MSSDVRALNDDVLAHIFQISSINTDINNWLEHYDGYAGALIAFRISQVCSRWRGLIMNLPSLWGRLVDLSSNRSTRSFLWETEIIRRSAHAPLSIRAEICTPLAQTSPHLDEHLLHVLRLEWERIQHLSIELGNHMFLDQDYHLVEGLSEVLKRPAPSLVTFSLMISEDDVESRTSLVLGPQAPLLRAIQCGCVAINDDACWLPNINKLSLDSRQFDMNEDHDHLYTLQTLFNVLRKTRSLQHLKLSILYDLDEIEDPTRHSLNSIPLHHLQSLILDQDLFPCVCLLKAIHLVNPLHQLKIYATSYVDDEDATDEIIDLIDDFIVLTMPLFHQYFGSNKVRILDIIFYDKLLILDTKTFRIKPTCELEGILGDAVMQSKFFDRLAHLDLQWIERLLFNLEDKFVRQFSHEKASFQRFFNTLRFLTTLSTSMTCLEEILSMKEYLTDAFPSLKTVKPVWSQYYRRPKAPGIIYGFLSWRIEQGCRVETLDIGSVSSWMCHHGSLVTLLEGKFLGLQVLWSEHVEGQSASSEVSYVVGNGDPAAHTVFTVFSL